MDPLLTKIILYIGFFVAGMIALMIATKGLLIQYFMSKKKGLLLQIKRKSGKNIYRAVKPDGGLARYKLGTIKYVVSVVPEACRPFYDTVLMVVDEGETAPYLFQKVVVVSEIKKILEKRDGKQVEVEVTVPSLKLFESWDDSEAIENHLMRAIEKPKIPLGSGLLGGIDMKKVLIFLAIAAVAVYFLMKMKGGGA